MSYNKFNVSSTSPPDNPPQHPNSDYEYVVATTGQWKVARCNEQHLVVCQSSYKTPSSKRIYYVHQFTLPISKLSNPMHVNDDLIGVGDDT